MLTRREKITEKCSIIINRILDENYNFHNKLNDNVSNICLKLNTYRHIVQEETLSSLLESFEYILTEFNQTILQKNILEVEINTRTDTIVDLEKKVSFQRHTLNESFELQVQFDEEFKKTVSSLENENSDLKVEIDKLHSQLSNCDQLLKFLQSDIDQYKSRTVKSVSTQATPHYNRTCDFEMQTDVSGLITHETRNQMPSKATQSSTVSPFKSVNVCISASWCNYSRISIIGDSFAIGFRKFLSERLPRSCKVSANIYTDALGSYFLKTDQYLGFNKNDCIIVCAGNSDVEYNKAKHFKQQIADFCRKLSGTNVFIIGIPYNYSLPCWSIVNNEVTNTNSYLEKLCKKLSITFIDLRLLAKHMIFRYKHRFPRFSFKAISILCNNICKTIRSRILDETSPEEDCKVFFNVKTKIYDRNCNSIRLTNANHNDPYLESSYVPVKNRNIDNNNLIKIMHHNVCSVRNKLSTLEVFVCERNIDVICLTEHWLTELEMPYYVLDGYYICSSFSRKQYKGGGVMLMVRNNLTLFDISNIKALSTDKHFECAAAKLVLNNVVNLLILVVYRSPDGDIEIFFDRIIQCIDRLLSSNNCSRLLLCGDLNIDFLSRSSVRNRLYDIMYSFKIDFTINEPTR
ncbi:hypothetical protein O3M35_012456 [Rhynocoris fuscipes]|uniref:Endonuclease/exonuclease/phosphatase domain-containing protein n=1 Tax=Rhynocoris fuscipes TaxID=488301 RepID=A0AAW1CUX2_9HEMI